MILKEFIYKDFDKLESPVTLDIKICKTLLDLSFENGWDMDYSYTVLFCKENEEYTLYLIEVTGSYLCE
jgi:hypothetical protein